MYMWKIPKSHVLTLFWLSSWADPAGEQGIWKIKLAVSLEILVRTSHDKQLDPSPGPIGSPYKNKNNNKKGRISPHPQTTELSGSAHDHVTCCSYMYCRSLWKHPDINGNIRPCLQKNCTWNIYIYHGRC